MSEAPLSSPAAAHDDADSPYGDPERLRRTYQEADRVESRFYPAWSLASHGEPGYLETVLGELEAGPLNFSLIRYARESHSERFPLEVSEHFAGIAADESRSGDVRQIAYFLSRRSRDAAPGALPTAPPECADLREHATGLADALLQSLEEGEVYLNRDDLVALRYLDPERATRLVTLLHRQVLEAASAPDQGYMAGNETALLVASLGPEFVPDIPALFEVYLYMHARLMSDREEWYLTRDDNILFRKSNYLAVSWQLAWTVSRAGIQGALDGLAPALSSSHVEARIAAVHLLEDAVRYAPVDEPPQFGGGNGPPLWDKLKSLFSPKPLKNLQASVAHPRQLSKRYASSFQVAIFPKEKRDEAHRLLKRGSDRSKIEDFDESPGLTPGLTVVISLSSRDISFDEPVTKRLEDQVIATLFQGKPNDKCDPGDHEVTLRIKDKATDIELQAHKFEVRVVDFAFDHVSRPFLMLAFSVVTGLGSLAVYLLTLLSLIDTAFGFVSGTVVGTLATGNYLRLRSLFQQPHTLDLPTPGGNKSAVTIK